MATEIKLNPGHKLVEKRIDTSGRIKSYITLSADGKKYNLYVAEEGKFVRKESKDTPKFSKN